MALALLSALSPAGPRPRFRFELGTNRYWAYVVGGETARRADGIETIAEPRFRSPLAGPVPEHSLGRGEFEVDPALFDHRHRRIQLASYRTSALQGPAVSEVLTISAGVMRGDLPPPVMPEGLTMTAPHAAAPQTLTHPAPFRYREASYSNAMFLDALGGVLRGILPSLGNILPGLLGGLRGAAAPGGGGAAAPLADLLRRASDPDLLRALIDLLRQVEGASAGTPSAAPAAPAAGGGAAASLSARALAMGPVPRGRRSRIPSGPLPRCRHYSEAQVAPALLAALPALAPLLQQVLNPQTIQTVLDAPNRATQTVLNGLLDLGKLGLKEQQQLNEHLERLNPGVRDPGLEALLASMSLGLAQAAADDYARVGSVSIDFELGPAVSLAGQERVVYRAGRPLAFPLTVETPRTIPQATLRLEVKDAETLAVRARREWPVEQVGEGPMLTVPTLDRADIDRLTPNRRYLVCATLKWNSKKGRRRGTSRHLEITLAGAFTFDRVEDSGEPIPLDDPDRFRDYWHKVWEGTLERGGTRRRLDTRYYYVLKPGRHANARLETRIRRDGDPESSARVRSGMELSSTGLNRLLTQLAPESPPLGEDELDALQTPEMVERLSLAARYTADFRGRPGARVALWVYPEVKLQRVILQQDAETSEHGQVTALGEHEVSFPVPAVVHFIGTKSI